MATIAQEQERSSGGLGGLGCVLMIVVGGFLVLALMATGLPALNDHATDKHGAEASEAWRAINSLPVRDYCKWKCSDGRDRYVCKMPGGNNDWAVAVVETGHLITSFITNQEYAKGIIDAAGCSNPWHLRHP